MPVSPDPPAYRAHTFEDLLNVVPTLFGFVPRHCVIGIAVSGPQRRFGFRLRVDIPADRGEDDRLAELVAEHLRRNADDEVILIALCVDPAVGEDLLHAVGERLGELRVCVKLWATEDRLWTDLPQCPPEGEPYVLSELHEARVAAIAAGQVVAEDRSVLYEEIAPPQGSRLIWLESALETIEADLAPSRLRESGREAQIGLVGRLLNQRSDHCDGDLLRLGAAIASIEVRDAAWERIDRENARQMYALWCAVVRAMPQRFSVPALSLAGFAAWLRGDGARALIALERAREIRPRYSMASLLYSAVSQGLDPALWEDIRGVRRRCPPGSAARRSA